MKSNRGETFRGKNELLACAYACVQMIVIFHAKRKEASKTSNQNHIRMLRKLQAKKLLSKMNDI